jgi:SAM-dependent methyltransferase
MANVSIDDASSDLVHQQIIRSKTNLKLIYDSFYSEFIECAKLFKDGVFLEVGSGGGFLKDKIPGLITSDVSNSGLHDIVLDGNTLPFEHNSVHAIFMLNVFHHIKNVRKFLHEVDRVLLSKGRLVMVEPAMTVWSRLIYKTLHSEPMNDKAGWTIEGEGRLSDANIALPWIVFERDRDVFLQEFTNFSIERVNYHTPLSYLLSGGLSKNIPIPSVLFKLFLHLERQLSPLNKYFGMFCTITIVKK